MIGCWYASVPISTNPEEGQIGNARYAKDGVPQLRLVDPLEQVLHHGVEPHGFVLDSQDSFDLSRGDVDGHRGGEGRRDRHRDEVHEYACNEAIIIICIFYINLLIFCEESRCW